MISALGRRDTHVPFRDSKLTRLLQPALAGNSLTTLVATVGPALANRSETLSTLEFATRCSRVHVATAINLVAQANSSGSSPALNGAAAALADELSRLKADHAVALERLSQRHTAHETENAVGGSGLTLDADGQRHVLRLLARVHSQASAVARAGLDRDTLDRAVQARLRNDDGAAAADGDDFEPEEVAGAIREVDAGFSLLDGVLSAGAGFHEAARLAEGGSLTVGAAATFESVHDFVDHYEDLLRAVEVDLEIGRRAVGRMQTLVAAMRAALVAAALEQRRDLENWTRILNFTLAENANLRSLVADLADAVGPDAFLRITGRLPPDFDGGPAQEAVRDWT